MFKEIQGFIEDYAAGKAYMRGAFDGPPIPSVIYPGSVFQYKGQKLRPMGTDFRAVMYQNDRIGAQSLVNGQWVDVEEWEDGWFDGSQVGTCGWQRMSETCMRTKRGIELMRDSVLGIERPPEVI